MNVRVGLLLATGVTVLAFLTACGESDSPSLLARRVEASFDVTAKVTYEMVFDPAAADGVSGNPTTVTMTQAPWGRRYDGSSSTATATYSGSLLDLGDEQYVCGRATGFDPEGLREGYVELLEDGFCYSGESFGDSDNDWFDAPFDLAFSFKELLREYEDLDVTATAQRTIAGMDADCFSVTSHDAPPEELEVCFSQDNILLLMNLSSPTATAEAIALEVERDVNEGDFAIPYQVVDRP